MGKGRARIRGIEEEGASRKYGAHGLADLHPVPEGKNSIAFGKAPGRGERYERGV